MKKGFSFILCMILLCTIIVIPQEEAHAETLAEMRAKVNQLEAQYQAQQQEEKETQGKIDQNETTIASIQESIKTLEADIQKKKEEIENLQKQIKEKEKEIKSIISFMQISNGENAYLEYAMGAQDFTDFIYRMSVSEQLAAYNDSLTKEYEDMIAENEKKQKELDEKQKELNEQKAKLEEENKKMKDHLEEIATIKVDIKDQIRMQKESINMWASKGCGENEDVNACQNRILSQANNNAGSSGGGGNLLPPNYSADTTFLRPIISGAVTSEYGYRCIAITGCQLHAAIDVSQQGTVPVYASAPGMVIGITRRSKCGGNMVFVIHTINGQKYTTEYSHLRSISVSVGQMVTATTQIGIMGGNPATEWWDKCSEAQHLHFGMAKGHYLVDYTSWNAYLSHTYDPRQTVNFPWTGGKTDPFSNRTTIY